MVAVDDCVEGRYGDYACSIRHAIALRLFSLAARKERLDNAVSRKTSMPAWRLDRALQYIDANLANPIGLQDIADSAGVTRMHFAAQFRMAMGQSPHEYLRTKRIERSKAYLLERDKAVVDVALACGFRTHAHFGAVFKRQLGMSPNHWRAARLKQEGNTAGIRRDGDSPPKEE
jgi:AraC-like DNA-binding protein